MKRVCIWWSGASISIFDVAAGLTTGLAANGIQFCHYRTDSQIEAAGHMLNKLWQQTGKRIADRIEKFTPADVIYHANKGLLELCCRAQLEGGIDWVIAVSGMYQHPAYFRYIREVLKLPIALICTEAPYDLAAELQLAPEVDVVFTSERSVTPIMRTKNPRTYYLPHAWNPRVHAEDVALPVNPERPDDPIPQHDVVFVGTGFQERIDLLEALDWTRIGNLGLYGVWPTQRMSKTLRASVRGKTVPNELTSAMYRQAHAGLNLHRSSVRFHKTSPRVLRAESMNPRCYELAATGCFFVTDARAEVAEVFGSAVPTFDTPATCQALLERAMREPAWRQDCAAEARARIAEHNWTRRAADVVSILSDVAKDQAPRDLVAA